MDALFHFRVDLADDHDVMSSGRSSRSSFVSVLAPDSVAASLAAAQIAGSRGGIPVAVVPLPGT